MQNRERCLGVSSSLQTSPQRYRKVQIFFNNCKSPEGKILKSWLLSLTQKGKGKPQQGIFCCFYQGKGKEHVAYLGRTPMMCFLLCLFVQHIALLSTGICSQLLVRTLKAQHFPGTQHSHSCPSQAALSSTETSNSAALHALILISSHRCFHPFLGRAPCAGGSLAPASSGYLTETGGCKGLRGSPEAAEIV